MWACRALAAPHRTSLIATGGVCGFGAALIPGLLLIPLFDASLGVLWGLGLLGAIVGTALTLRAAATVSADGELWIQNPIRSYRLAATEVRRVRAVELPGPLRCALVETAGRPRAIPVYVVAAVDVGSFAAAIQGAGGSVGPD